VATKKIQLPLNSWGVLDVNKKDLIAIHHTPTIKWRLKFLVAQEGMGG
jgi:hypothetical protein